MAGAPPQAVKRLPEYYSEAGIPHARDVFKDFDDISNFQTFDKRVSSASSRNFVIDFGDDEAWCAFDLDAYAVRGLINTQRTANLNTRWINIWLPYAQVDILEELAQHYDFSPRLLGLMCAPHPKPEGPKKKPETPETSSFFRRSRNHGNHDVLPKTIQSYTIDMEKRASDDGSSLPEDVDPLREINHYKLVDEVWHWSSVDWGRKYVCVGYNSLYNVRTKPFDASEDENSRKDLPDGKRVWTWLLLLSDRTVISITEDPYPHRSKPLGESEENSLSAIRRNLVNVFRQLSKAHDTTHQNPITLLPVRKRLGNTVEETVHRPIDAPGLLFYCLFDDSATSYSLVARREHQYSAALDSLRKRMLEKAQLSHVEQLFNIGRQLAVLKRVYQSYELIIERLLDRQRHSIASLANSGALPPAGLDSIDSSLPQVSDGETLLGVPFSSAAKVRFERMRDRIRLYALSEIQECLDQKESLVMMNFNLIAIKESFSVERLTRVTLLLTKITMIFLPISIMTSYFSTQLVDVSFTLRSYWVAFGVILAIAICFMVGFGFYSGTMEGRIIYRPLSRKILDMCNRKIKWMREKRNE